MEQVLFVLIDKYDRIAKINPQAKYFVWGFIFVYGYSG